MDDAKKFSAALVAARSEALKAFGDDRLILERALVAPRHVEVQILADGHGRLLHLGERDCSIQRRHQKIVEEAPAPNLSTQVRDRLESVAVQVAATIDYVGAGTVECLVHDGAVYFMEMNTRLQVEHPVTEAITGLDLVEWQLRIACGEPLNLAQEDIRFSGHAIEVRLYAEDPAQDFLPQAGPIELWREPTGVRVDHGLVSGMELPPYYDCMLAKIIAHGATREESRKKLRRALGDTILFGVKTNRTFLRKILHDQAFVSGEASTAFIDHRFASVESRELVAGENVWGLA